MDILTLELFDVTVSQALLKVRSALERHPALPLRILVDADEMLRNNLQRFLERQGRPAEARAMEGHWQLDVPAGSPLAVLPAPIVERQAEIAPSHRPVLVLRSAFTPGDRALGRQLLLGVLGSLEKGTPWVLLAHDALELLDDPLALECLKGLQSRGIPIHLSKASQTYLGRFEPAFLPMDDAQWQSMLGKGELTVL
ncbi:MAG: hypothetical protein WAT51_11115 [Holophaga sp.]